MKIGIVSGSIPMAAGRHRILAEALEQQLLRRGHAVENIEIPFARDPATLLEQMIAFHGLPLGDYFETVIAIGPPAHAIHHRRKIVWLSDPLPIWRDEHLPAPLRAQIVQSDRMALRSAHAVFTISAAAARMIETHTTIHAEIVRPPLTVPDWADDQRDPGAISDASTGDWDRVIGRLLA